MKHKLWRRIKALLFPPRCAGCGTLLDGDASAGLCPICHANFLHTENFGCPLCNRPDLDCRCLPRYSSRTVKLLQYAHDSGATVVTITDKPEAPAGKVADYVLCAKSNMVSFVDSLVAPMSVVNALIVSVGLQQEDSVAKTYEDLERIWDEYDAFERVE